MLSHRSTELSTFILYRFAFARVEYSMKFVSTFRFISLYSYTLEENVFLLFIYSSKYYEVENVLSLSNI